MPSINKSHTHPRSIFQLILISSTAEKTPANETSHVDRAEQMVERVAENVSSFTAKWGRRAWSIVSRVREEAEDMWSEAQSIRRGDQR